MNKVPESKQGADISVFQPDALCTTSMLPMCSRPVNSVAIVFLYLNIESKACVSQLAAVIISRP